MEEIKKIFVEEGMIVVQEKTGVTQCHGLDIKGPSEMKSDDNGNIWIETTADLEKIVRIHPDNIRAADAK